MEGESGTEKGTRNRLLSSEGCTVLGYLCWGPRVPSYATADLAGLPT